MYLNSHSYYSLRYGTLSPEQLVAEARRHGITAMALTDVNNTSAAGEFVVRCKEAGIKPLLGIDFFKDGKRLYTGLARNAEGFYYLNKYLSNASLSSKPLPEVYNPSFIPHRPGSASDFVIIYDRLVRPIADFRENEYLGIRPEHVHGLFSSDVRKHPHKLLIFSPITFVNEEGYELHRLLRAIDANTLMTKLNPDEVARKTETLHPPAVLEDFYKLYPRIIENTRQLAEECHTDLETGLQINRQTFTGSPEGDFKLLEKLAMEGYKRRYASRQNSESRGSYTPDTPHNSRQNSESRGSYTPDTPHNSRQNSESRGSYTPDAPHNSRQNSESRGSYTPDAPHNSRQNSESRGSYTPEAPHNSRQNSESRGSHTPDTPHNSRQNSESRGSHTPDAPHNSRQNSESRGSHTPDTPHNSRQNSESRGSYTPDTPHNSRQNSKSRGSYTPEAPHNTPEAPHNKQAEFSIRRGNGRVAASLPGGSGKVKDRLLRELKVIREMDFCAYFLITWDIVRYAHAAGYHHVGRGSGANSIVAYCLGITDVDPIDLDLYFERFINKHRPSPPDFDIDFSWDERDDVTDYIFKRYGREHTALLATYSTFQFNAAIREVGKVYGLPKEEIDKLGDEILRATGTRDIRYWSPQPLKRSSQPEENRFQVQKAPKSGQTSNTPSLPARILHFARQLQGFPNHLSIHAGGVVISEKPIFYHTALQLMPKGFPISHFDMHHGEDLGFHKFDVLSQRGLGHIKDAVDLVKMNRGMAVDIHDIPAIKQDEQVRAQLKSGHCIGCFYVESPAMRGLLKKLRCEDYKHLVAASSIIRPGVAKSGMMKEYIRRFHNPHSFKYLHPVFEEHLGETYGVMVYQEDVMKIVHHFAGLGLDEADMLRRLMSGKKRKGDQFEVLQKKYFDNCKKRGHPDALAKEVWRQVESFAGYSFCKAHSASFAVESFQSLYLKAYFPLEFMVAVINNFGGFYRTEYYFHEAKMAGATIHAPCVNHSLYLTSIRGTDIYTGFVHLNQLERMTAHKIVHQRAVGGPFRSLADFVSRVEVASNQLDILIRIGAFRFTGMGKCALMWEKNAVFNPKLQTGRTRGSELLFPDETEQFELPQLEEGPLDQAFDEIELLGFPLCSPFDLLAKQEYTAEGITADDMPRCIGRMAIMVGYYVTRKDVRTVKKELMHFGTWLDREGRFFDTVHFPNFLRTSPFRGKGIYRIEGRVVEEYGFPSLEVVKMERLAFREDERYG